MTGVQTCALPISDQRVTVDMGPPIFEAPRVPFVPDGLLSRLEGEQDLWRLPVGATHCEVAALSMGNPHAVQTVADVDTAEVATLGPLIEHHAAFPRRVNAGFLQVRRPNGEPAFTRAGQLQIDANGTLVNAQGLPLAVDNDAKVGALAELHHGGHPDNAGTLR